MEEHREQAVRHDHVTRDAAENIEDLVGTMADTVENIQRFGIQIDHTSGVVTDPAALVVTRVVTGLMEKVETQIGTHELLINETRTATMAQGERMDRLAQ